MPARTRASIAAIVDEEGETDWAAAAAAAADMMAPPQAQALALDDYPTQEGEESEEWVNADDRIRGGGNDDDDDHKEEEDYGDDDNDDDGELTRRRDNIENTRRPPWILQVAIPGGHNRNEVNDNTTNDHRDQGLASVFIDSDMTAERLGRCIVQAVSLSSTSSDARQQYSLECEDISSINRILVGLFRKHDGVFYSLESILAMKPEDGERHTFCVTKPVHRRATNDKDESSSILSYITTSNFLVAVAILFLSIFIAHVVSGRLDHRMHFIYSLLLIFPNDLPSMWRIVSLVLDWPAREVYRFGPSVIGWEGRELIDICTQMNRRYYFAGIGGGGGNEYDEREYWSRNPEACETVYRMKEESFVRMCRPLWYLTLMAVSFVVIQRLIAAAFAKEPRQPLNRTDRVVLQTYRALQMLAREHYGQEERQQQQQVGGRRPVTGR